MFAYDKTFDPEVVLGHCDLISRFSDFALYLDTQLVYFHTFLAHLSRRLIGELIVYPCSGVRPSSVVRRPSVVHNFKDLLL